MEVHFVICSARWSLLKQCGNLLCTEVGTMSEVEVLKATAHMAPSIGYDWLVMDFSCVEAE